MAENSKDTQSNKWQLTINNPGDDFTHEKIKEILFTSFKSFEYACMSDECGTTLHTHVFVYFKSRKRFSTLKKVFPTAHIERCKASIKENIAYIEKSGKWENDDKHGTKIEGTFEEIGKRPKTENHGKNSTMEELYTLVSEGYTNAEILAYNNDLIREISAMDRLRATLQRDEFQSKRRLNLSVTYVYGATGTGKTRGVLDVYGDRNVFRVTDYNHSFDGYAGQPVIVFDEFRSSLKLGEMLNYLDIYSTELTARYENKLAGYNTVYIISNWALEKQYSDLQATDRESWQAFLRRIHKVQVFFTDKILIYPSVADYLGRGKHETIVNPYSMPNSALSALSGFL